MSQLRGKADSASGVVNETRMVCRRIYLYISIENFLQKLLERGQKLGELEQTAQKMTDEAQEFASLSHKIMLKQKEKAEWWPWTSKKS